MLLLSIINFNEFALALYKIRPQSCVCLKDTHVRFHSTKLRLNVRRKQR